MIDNFNDGVKTLVVILTNFEGDDIEGYDE